MIYAPTNRRIIRPYDKPSFEHTQRYGLIKGHWANINRVGLWAFNEGSGNTVYDLSGNNNHGSSAGWNIPWVSDFYGPALKFTGGTNNTVTIPHSPSLNLSSQVTVIAHFIHDGAAWDTHNTVVAKGAWDDAYGLLVLDTGKARFIAETAGAGDDYVEATNTVSVGQRITLAGTYDGSALRIYINGILDNTYVRSGALVTNGNSVVFQYGDNNWDWDGRMFFVSIYNLALTPTEIAQVTWNPFLGIQREPRITYFFVPTGGVVYQELNLIVSADASVSESDTQQMVDTGKAVSADASILIADTQQMVETEKPVEAAASISCTDLKVVFELNLTVTASGSVVATEAHTMMETGKNVTAIALPAVIDTQAMVETELDVSAEGSVSCTDTMGLLAHIAAFMILRQCTT